MLEGTLLRYHSDMTRADRHRIIARVRAKAGLPWPVTGTYIMVRSPGPPLAQNVAMGGLPFALASTERTFELLSNGDAPWCYLVLR